MLCPHVPDEEFDCNTYEMPTGSCGGCCWIDNENEQKHKNKNVTARERDTMRCALAVGHGEWKIM
jgi:hypothetical protein